MATPGQVGQPEAGQSEGPLVQVIVENLLGHRESIIVPSTATVRQLKQEIEARMKVRVSSQTLIRRRPTGGSEVGYKQLDDAKTLDQYNIGDGERVLLVPSMRSAPPGYELKEGGTSSGTKVFIDTEGGSAVSIFIDRALAEKGEKRDPNAVYLLVQMPGQPEGVYTIVMYQPGPKPTPPSPAETSAEASRSVGSNSGESGVDPAVEAEYFQNLKTQSVMSKLRASIEAKKRKKNAGSTMANCPKCGCSMGRCKCEKKPTKTTVATSTTKPVATAASAEKAAPPFSNPRKTCNIS